MSLLRSFPAMAFVLVLLSIAGLCAAQHSVSLLLVTGTLAALSWPVTEGPRGRTLPRWVSNILVLAVILNVFRDLLQNLDDMMGVLGRFTLLLTLVKLYERRAARDYAQLLALSLVLMVTGCMQSSDLIFGIVLLLYVVLGLYVLLLYQLHAAYESARTTRQAAVPPGYRLAPLLRPIIGRHVGLHFRLFAAAVGLAGVALSAALFVTFPRGLGADILNTLRAPPADRTPGFSWEVNLMSGGRINRSPARAFTVQFLDGEKPLRMAEPVYLRGAVLDRYNGQGSWTTLEGNTHRHHLTAGRYKPLIQGVDAGHTIITQRFGLSRALAGRVPLFSIYAPIGLSMDSATDVLYDPEHQTIRTGADTRRVVGYTVYAQLDPTFETQRVMTEGITPRRSGWFADRDDRVGDRARSVLADAGLGTQSPSINADENYSDAWDWNRRAAQVFTDYLHGPEFAYTLDFSDVTLRGRDPVISFLLETKRGQCEYFASALTAMCHSVEIPARLVVGYIAQNYDSQAEHYAVVEGNAHAWVEVATGSHRWTNFDPTPPAGLPSFHEDSGTLAYTMRSVYQRFEGEWSTGVVGFDTVSQERLMDSLSQGWTRRVTTALEGVREWMERVNIFFNVGVGGYIWMAIVVLALVLAAIALVKVMRRSVALRRALHLQHVRGREYRRMLQQLGFYLDMLRVLHRAGHPKPDWQPPLAFAGVLEGTQPQPARLVRQITGVFYEARYGHAEMDRRRIEAAREQVRELAGRLRVRV